ncbi:RIO1 family regulatory kinase/ATPase domain-containing protein [Thermogladius sp. 4427co]|uniref:RIO1 family regulatory kinase/ATPase domain-containing protein n=1 Tax=Thermogladius sp. 4427co TaxID=3450718 RepID=UPI003F7A3102
MLKLVNIGLIYKSLSEEDFIVLRALERLSRRFEFVPVESLLRETRIYEEKLSLILSKLHRLKLLKARIIGSSRAYRLTYLSLDMLALKSLVDRNIITAIGDKIGVGKESDLFQALAPGNEVVVVKFLRIGRTSFRRTKITRSWTLSSHASWYDQSRVAAEREYKALAELYALKAYVPKPYGYNRHATVIQYIEGEMLYERPELSNPEEVLWRILETLRIAYTASGIVHGDLSEYNIIVSRNGIPYVIDWPQYVYRDEPNAQSLLERDIKYVLRFFEKVYGVQTDFEKALKYVTGT